MRIKLDENMPATLAEALSACGRNTDVWRETQRTERFLITQDLDFSDTRRFRPGTHHGLLLVRLVNPGRKNLIDQITSAFMTEDVESWQRCFVVLTERKIRIQRP